MIQLSYPNFLYGWNRLQTDYQEDIIVSAVEWTINKMIFTDYSEAEVSIMGLSHINTAALLEASKIISEKRISAKISWIGMNSLKVRLG